jgi:hypothetical protein
MEGGNRKYWLRVKKSGLVWRPDVFFESAVKYKQIDKKLSISKKERMRT